MCDEMRCPEERAAMRDSSPAMTAAPTMRASWRAFSPEFSAEPFTPNKVNMLL
jgi:hypothetical protein